MTRVYELPTVEREAIALLLTAVGVPQQLRDQLKRAEAVTRESSAAGVYVNFSFSGETAPLNGMPNFHIADVSASTSDAKEIDFILYIRGGLLSCLEVYSIYDVLPSYESITAGPTGIPKLYI